jgi:hypothetical protein
MGSAACSTRVAGSRNLAHLVVVVVLVFVVVIVVVKILRFGRCRYLKVPTTAKA